MLGESPPLPQRSSFSLSAPTDQAASSSQNVASHDNSRFRWTGFGFSALVLIGLLAPFASEASAKPAHDAPGVAIIHPEDGAFIPSNPLSALSSGRNHPATTGLREKHVPSVALRAAAGEDLEALKRFISEGNKRLDAVNAIVSDLSGDSKFPAVPANGDDAVELDGREGKSERYKPAPNYAPTPFKARQDWPKTQQPGMKLSRSGFVRSALVGAVGLGGGVSAQAQEHGFPGFIPDQETVSAAHERHQQKRNTARAAFEAQDLQEAGSDVFSKIDSPYSKYKEGDADAIRKVIEGGDAQAPAVLPEVVTCGSLKLTNLKFVGQGVQAQIFSAEIAGKSKDISTAISMAGKPVVLKLSKLSNEYAKQTFKRESRILRQLEASKVPNVVRVLSEGEVLVDGVARNGIVLSPFLAEAVPISVKSRRTVPLDVPSLGLDMPILRQLLKTAVQVLDAGIAGVDVQVLQQQGTGTQLWIDFTEAAILSPTEVDNAGASGPPGMALQVEAPFAICPGYEDKYKSVKAAALGFATEVFLLIPPSSHAAAAAIVAEELCELAKSDPVRGPGKELQKVWGFLPWYTGKEENGKKAVEGVKLCAATAAGKSPSKK